MTTDPRIIPVPPGADLTGTGKAIAAAHGVSPGTALRWKREAGLPVVNCGAMCRGLRPRTRAKWAVITPGEWARGDAHVARKMGVATKSAKSMRAKLGIAPGPRTVWKRVNKKTLPPALPKGK